jgi:hypothetical protein
MSEVLREPPQHRAGMSDETHLRLVQPINLGRIDVDLDDLERVVGAPG